MPTLSIIDLRSDTVTRPTPAMRDAMMHAPVGDDVLGDDPTVLALEAHAAQLLGKEAAMFVPSGTMANQCAIRVHTQPGDEIICHEGSHIIHYEGGAPAVISGCMTMGLAGLHGRFTVPQFCEAIRPDNSHYPRSRLLVIENTHNRGGGSVWPMAQLGDVTRAAKERGLATHMDGARLWNAAVALGVATSSIASHFDSVSACLSKGLGAPVGSVLVGASDFVAKARRVRKMLGGGMRQAGMLAGAGLHALQHHIARLHDDHLNAKLLAASLAAIPGIALSEQHELAALREAGAREPQTNIVLFETSRLPAAELCERLRTQGVLALPTAKNRVRFVTHLDVSREQCQRVGEVVRQVLTQASA